MADARLNELLSPVVVVETEQEIQGRAPNEFRGDCAFLLHRLQPMSRLRMIRLTNANPHRQPIFPTPTLASKLVRRQSQTSTAVSTNAVQDCRSQAFVRTTWTLSPREPTMRKHAVVLLLFRNRIRCRTMIWKARHGPFEPRTPSKAGTLPLASRFGLFA